MPTRALGDLQPSVTSRGWQGLQAQLRGGPREAPAGCVTRGGRPPSHPYLLRQVLVQICEREISEASEKRSGGPLCDLRSSQMSGNLDF